MRRSCYFSLVVLSAVALFGIEALPAQDFRTRPCEGGQSSGGFLAHLFSQERACEVRSATFGIGGGPLRIRGFNGSVEVVGEDRSDVALEARLEVHARTEAAARSFLHEISILTDGTITARGPKNDPHDWSASYRLHVPRRLAVDIETSNGSMKLASLEGDIRAQTSNGSLSVSNLSGNVRLTTTNGSASVVLDGATWRGGGLAVRSTNGSMRVQMPAGYSAHLVARTTNGDVSGEFPNRRYGQPPNSLDTSVGRGGPTLDFDTTNGHIAFTAN